MSYKSKTWRLDLQLYCFAPAKCPLSCSKCLSVTCQTIKIVGRIETCELKGKLNTHKTHTQKKNRFGSVQNELKVFQQSVRLEEASWMKR